MNNPVIVLDSVLDAACVSFIGQPTKIDRNKLDSPYAMRLLVDGNAMDMVASHDQLAEARATLLKAMGVAI